MVLKHRTRLVVVFTLLITGTLIGFGGIISMLKSGREAAIAARCLGRCSMLAGALQNYRGAHGHFPPAYITDKDGKPMHSWRVLLLPYLDCQDLYNRYRFSEPWDGPHNRLLADEIPDIYRCSRLTANSATTTSFVAIVGQETVWPGSRTVCLTDIRDGPAKTVVVVELAESDICWMEPRDLSLDKAVDGLGSTIRPVHPNGLHLLFADGSTKRFAAPITANLFRALLTANGTEPLCPSDDLNEFVLGQDGLTNRP